MSMESDPVSKKESSKEYAWWIDNIDHKINDKIRDVLTTYSHVPPENVKEHIYAIREKAWAIRVYPCTGLGAFLTASIPKHPAYSKILSSLHSGGKLLDIGCFMGYDLRHLALAGVPQNNLFGTDIVDFWQLGYEMFQDKDRFGAKFIESDIMHPNEDLMRLSNMDVISIIHVLHQWGWDGQVAACRQICNTFSKPGTMIVGYQGGTNDREKRSELNVASGNAAFSLHDSDTFREMWEEVGKETGTEWETQAEIVPWEELGYLKDETMYIGDDFSLLRFLVTRLK